MLGELRVLGRESSIFVTSNTFLMIRVYDTSIVHLPTILSSPLFTKGNDSFVLIGGGELANISDYVSQASTIYLYIAECFHLFGTYSNMKD